MSFKRIFLILLIFIASCHSDRLKSKKIWIQTETGYELLNGNIKQVVTKRYGSKNIDDVDTTIFDRNGNPIKTVKIYSDSSPVIIRISYKSEYDNHGKKLKTIGYEDKNILVYNCNDNGYIEKLRRFGTDTSRANLESTEEYHYNDLGELVELYHFVGDFLRSHVHYKYYRENWMSGSYHDGSVKMLYHYITTDKEGNWTKRTNAVWIEGNRSPSHVYITERKITYY